MAVLVAISAIVVLLVPHKYLDFYLANKNKLECALNVKYELKNDKPPATVVARDLEQLSLLSDNDKQERKPGGSARRADETMNNGEGDDSMIRDDNDSMLSDFSLKESLFMFWENTEFLMIMISIIGFMFCASGIQFWMATYLEKVLDIDPLVTVAFCSITCFSAPVFGVVTGGLLTTYFGGFEARST